MGHIAQAPFIPNSVTVRLPGMRIGFGEAVPLDVPLLVRQKAGDVELVRKVVEILGAVAIKHGVIDEVLEFRIGPLDAEVVFEFFERSRMRWPICDRQTPAAP